MSGDPRRAHKCCYFNRLQTKNPNLTYFVSFMSRATKISHLIENIDYYIQNYRQAYG